MAVFTLVPFHQPSALKPIPLNPGTHVIGRVLDPSLPNPTTIKARTLGVPPALLNFLSRKHLRLDVASQGSVLVTALTSMQDTNQLVRLNPTPALTAQSPSSGGQVLAKDAPTAMVAGDLIVLLAGAKQETTGCGDELIYVLESSAPDASNGSSPTAGGDTQEIDLGGSNASSPVAAADAAVAAAALRGGGSANEASSEEAALKKRKVSSENASSSSSSSSSSSPPPTSSAADDALLETVTCTICFELLVDPWAVPCSQTHTFCRACIMEWLGTRRECPQCQAAIPPGNDGNRNQVIVPMMEALRLGGIINGDNLRTWEERKGALQAAAGSESTGSASAPPPPAPGGGNTVVELIDSDDDERSSPDVEVIDLS